jgi:hypothetical protein
MADKSFTDVKLSKEQICFFNESNAGGNKKPHVIYVYRPMVWYEI